MHSANQPTENEISARFSAGIITESLGKAPTGTAAFLKGNFLKMLHNILQAVKTRPLKSQSVVLNGFLFLRYKSALENCTLAQMCSCVLVSFFFFSFFSGATG